jgi:hypothetical protein
MLGSRTSFARSFRAACLLAAALLAGTAGAAAKPGEPIFKLDDPRGDDHGDGSITYPLRYYGMSRGDLDMLSFEARAADGGTEFAVTFANPIRKPARRTIDEGGTQLDDVARFGFYAFNVDIYIDTDRVPRSGAVNTLPGRNAQIAPENAWEKVICLTPRPFEARSELKRILLKQLKHELVQEKGRVDKSDADLIRHQLPDDVETHIFFPTRINVYGRTVKFFVPDSFLGGPAKDTWSYVVFVTGADIDQRFDYASDVNVLRGADNLLVLPLATGSPDDRFGGRRDDDPLQPPIIDLLVPPGKHQEDILRDYDLRTKRQVQLPGVVPAEVAAAKEGKGGTGGKGATPPKQ